jgi:hypothetical protein
MRALAGAAGLVLIAAAALAQTPSTSAPQALSAAEIAERMLSHNRAQADRLRHYQDTRHYHVEYRGFGTSVSAAMEVEVTFDAATGPSFRIKSQSGSKLLCEKVLKKAIDSEKEASHDKGANALTPANYKFELAGTESLDGRPAYILQVEPWTPSKFLYRGKVWVDATDFAVSKIESEPVKNPSFWILRPQIHFRSAKLGDFWLPQINRSETKVRVGGTATLTIDYGTYQFDEKTRDTAMSPFPPNPRQVHAARQRSSLRMAAAT